MDTALAPLTLETLMENTMAAFTRGGMSAFLKAQPSLFDRHLSPVFFKREFQTRTARGRAPLTNAADMLGYNAFYGTAHYVGFRHILHMVRNELLPQSQEGLNAKIIDYGCGQGMATLALLEHIKHQPHGLNDADIHLIEPSPLSLLAARTYIWAARGQKTGMYYAHPHPCLIDDIPQKVYSQNAKPLTLHLFSNSLDLAAEQRFDLPRLMAHIRTLPGKHILLASSPVYELTRPSFARCKSALPNAKILLDERFTFTFPTGLPTVSMRGPYVPPPRTATRYALALQWQTR